MDSRIPIRKKYLRIHSTAGYKYKDHLKAGDGDLKRDEAPPCCGGLMARPLAGGRQLGPGWGDGLYLR